MALHTQACQGLCVLNVCESTQLGLLVEIRSQLEKALCAGLSGCSIASRLRYPVFRCFPMSPGMLESQYLALTGLWITHSYMLE